jgi:hypothetical protein
MKTTLLAVVLVLGISGLLLPLLVEAPSFPAPEQAAQTINSACAG